MQRNQTFVSTCSNCQGKVQGMVKCTWPNLRIALFEMVASQSYTTVLLKLAVIFDKVEFETYTFVPYLFLYQYPENETPLDRGLH